MVVGRFLCYVTESDHPISRYNGDLLSNHNRLDIPDNIQKNFDRKIGDNLKCATVLAVVATLYVVCKYPTTPGWQVVADVINSVNGMDPTQLKQKVCTWGFYIFTTGAVVSMIRARSRPT
jgi:hypothetical protein